VTLINTGKHENGPEIPAFRVIDRFADVDGKSPKVSGFLRKYSRFGETMSRDWFDHDCQGA
jgi:hypothetical protein